MKIELKNVKHSKFASHETACFEATLVIDGKPLCIVSNQGHGGCDDYCVLKPGDSYGELRKRISEINEELGKQIHDFTYGGKTHKLANSLEQETAKALDFYLNSRKLKRDLKKKVIYRDRDGGLYEYRVTPQHSMSKIVEHVKQKYPGSLVLNELPFEEAYKYLVDEG